MDQRLTYSNHSPYVSIIINNYNYAQFLPEAIESSLNQTYLQVEVIVVDDGSTDHSALIIQQYGDRVLPILKPNGGQASAMNVGFSVSKGDIVVFLDADDYLFPTAIEDIVDAWHPGVCHLQSRLELVDVDGKYIDLYPAPEISFDTGDVRPLLFRKGRYNTTVTSGNSFSRAVLEQILPIPEAEFRISADGYLVTVAPLYGQVLSLEQPIGARRKHSSNFWASSGVQLKPDQFRKSFQHDFLRYKYLTERATQLGQAVSPNLGLHDHLHVADRLVSLRLDPARHPVPTDNAVHLAVKGFWAIWQHSTFRPTRKFILSVWFLCVGLLPSGLATIAISWKFAGKNRPKVIDRLLKRVRAATS